MYDKLRIRVDELFENAPKSHRANELKEELMANLIDKYNDLIAAGKDEDEAVKSALASVGDIDELIRGLRQYDVFDYDQMKKDREKSALIVSISVAMYIMSVVVMILGSDVFHINDNISVCLMFTIDAVATGLLIYNFMSKPKYKKQDTTVVEEFKEWTSVKAQERRIMQSMKSIVWSLTVAIYFYVSFVYHIWSYSWIIFIIGGAIEKIIALVFEMRK